MKAKLIVEGKEFPIEILDKELQRLISGKKITGYERVDEGHTYYTVLPTGSVFVNIQSDNEYSNSDKYYNAASYYSSKEVAENNARADRLMRQLRRFAVEHREKELDWNDASQTKYCLYYDGIDAGITVDHEYTDKLCGVVYFDTYATAAKAAREFRDELIWYFTEYKDSL